MSSNPVQSHLLERVASRRNVVRGAAVWSAAAVTVVVAAPNVAAASTPPPVLTPVVTVTPFAPVKYSVKDDKFVAWDIDVRCTNMALSGLALQMTYNQTGGGGKSTLDKVVVRNYPPAGTWVASITKSSMVATAVASTATAITQGVTGHIHIQFEGADNSSGEVTATLLANNSAGQQVVVWSSGTPAGTPTSWESGSVHTH